MKSHIKFIFAILVVLLGTCISGYPQEPLTVIRQMITNCRSIHTVQFIIDTKERINGRIVHEINSCKINSNPFKIYAKQSVPVKNLEVLYVTGQNGDKLKINPASFPWVTLNLNPENILILNNHHHTILESGFVYISTILENFILKNESQNSRRVEKFSKATVYGSDCYVITLTNPDYGKTGYVTSGVETALTIAEKMGINFHSILENNPGLKLNEKIAPGSRIVVPNDYASKIEIFIHQDKLYPVKLSIYDPKGLFEEYLFTGVTINPGFTANIFTPDNLEYHF